MEQKYYQKPIIQSILKMINIYLFHQKLNEDVVVQQAFPLKEN
jgi:hypothetical protein